MNRALFTASLLIAATASFADTDYLLETTSGNTIAVTDGHWTDNQELVYTVDETGRKTMVPGVMVDGTISFSLLVLDSEDVFNLMTSALAGKPLPIRRIVQRDQKTGDAIGVSFEECVATEITFPGFDKTVKPKGTSMPHGTSININCRVAGKKIYVGNLPFSAADRVIKGGDRSISIDSMDISMLQLQADGSVRKVPVEGLLKSKPMIIKVRRDEFTNFIDCGEFQPVVRGGSLAAALFREWFTMQTSPDLAEERNIEVVYRGGKKVLGTFTLIGCGLKRAGWNSDCDDDYIPDLSCAAYVQRIKWSRNNANDG